MHEIALMQRLVGSADEAAKKAGFTKIKKISLRIGLMNGFNEEQFKFCFGICDKSKAFDNVVLELEFVPVTLKCEQCGFVFEDESFSDYEFAHKISHAPDFYEKPKCPECNSKDLKIIKGREFQLISIDGE